MEWLAYLAPAFSFLGVIVAGRGWNRSRRARRAAQIRDDLDLWRALPGGESKRDLLARIERDVKNFTDLDSRPLAKDQIIIRVSLLGLGLTLTFAATYILAPTENVSPTEATELLIETVRFALIFAIVGVSVFLLALLATWFRQWLKSRRQRDSSPPV